MKRSTKKALIFLIAALVVVIIVIIILASDNTPVITEDQMGTTVIAEMAEAAASDNPEGKIPGQPETETVPQPVDIPNEKEVKLYVDMGGEMHMVTEHRSVWSPSYDIAIFEAFNSDEPVIYYDNYYTVHQNYWNAVSTDRDYKIGYELHMDVDGEHKTYTILSPADIEKNPDLFMGDADNDEVTGYMGVWVYCDMYHDSMYIHLTSADMADGVLMTSIKLRPTPAYESVSNLRLKVFSYSSDDEIGPDGRYIGTHGYEIPIYNQ